MIARRDLVCLLTLVALFALAVAATGLGGDYPLNDDWAYAWSARHLAETGQVRILDWAAPALVTHIAWGGALVKLFGPSYVVLRKGTLCWSLVGMLALYGIGRRSCLPPRSSTMLAAAVVFSPWYFGISFTYLTDIPWLALMLLAFFMLLSAERGQAPLLLGAGMAVSAAALSRQFAVMAVPAALCLIALDARRAHPMAWKGTAIARGALFAAPVVLAYGAFTLWYTYVHGPTLANRETWQRILHSTPLHLVGHVLATWHYLGLWMLPFVLGLAATHGLAGQVSRRLARTAVALLLGYAVFVHLETYLDPNPALGHNALRPPQMPFLSNTVYNFGIGAQTTTDVYHAKSPFPHHWLLLGYLLIAASTYGGVYAAAWILASARRAAMLVRGPRASNATDPVPPPQAKIYQATETSETVETYEIRARDRARVLLVGAATLHLAWVFCTSTFLFDRYILVVMPAAVWVALDRVGPVAATSRIALALVGVLALFSVAGTREYLSWNAARDLAVRELEARGVPSTDIDGGFEVNGPRRFSDWFARHHTIYSSKESPWWGESAPYRISFWPARDARCTTVARYPYASILPWEERAMYVLDCGTNRWP